MGHASLNPKDFFARACCFEASLLLIAVILGWLIDVDPFAALAFSEPAFVYGVIGTVPLAILFHLAEFWPSPSFQKIRRLLLGTLGPSLEHRHWTDLLLLASIAGCSEEVLFRGVLQPWLETTWGMWQGFIACNLLFGIVHAITPLYAVLAFGVGVYLSLALDYGGERNLLVPIVIHGLYDFWALWILIKQYKRHPPR